VPLGATAEFRAAAVHGIMTMTRGKGRYALKHHPHQHEAMNASPVVGAPPPIGAPSPVIWPGAVSSSDHADYVKNLRESGYNPKNDFNANGTVKVQ
jgi:hypothetical protein